MFNMAKSFILAGSIWALIAVPGAYAANLNIDDSAEGEITLSHDANWEGGVNSNGTAFGGNVPGSTTASGESASFSGSWIVNNAGSPDPGDGIVYIVEPGTDLISDTINAHWETSSGVATIKVTVESTARCDNLGRVPSGFQSIEETGGFVGILGSFVDPQTGDPVSIPSNLTMQFASANDGDCTLAILDALEAKLDAVETKLDTLTTTLGDVAEAVDTLETKIDNQAPSINDQLGVIESKLDNPPSQRQQAPGQLGDTGKP